MIDSLELEEKLERDNLTLKEHISKLQSTIKQIKSEIGGGENKSKLTKPSKETKQNFKINPTKLDKENLNLPTTKLKEDNDDLNHLKFSFNNCNNQSLHEVEKGISDKKQIEGIKRNIYGDNLDKIRKEKELISQMEDFKKRANLKKKFSDDEFDDVELDKFHHNYKTLKHEKRSLDLDQPEHDKYDRNTKNSINNLEEKKRQVHTFRNDNDEYLDYYKPYKKTEESAQQEFLISNKTLEKSDLDDSFEIKIKNVQNKINKKQTLDNTQEKNKKNKNVLPPQIKGKTNYSTISTTKPAVNKRNVPKADQDKTNSTIKTNKFENKTPNVKNGHRPSSSSKITITKKEKPNVNNSYHTHCTHEDSFNYNEIASLRHEVEKLKLENQKLTNELNKEREQSKKIKNFAEEIMKFYSK